MQENCAGHGHAAEGGTVLGRDCQGAAGDEDRALDPSAVEPSRSSGCCTYVGRTYDRHAYQGRFME